MKHTLLYIAAATMLGAMVMTGCDDDFARPPMVYPVVTDIVPNTTIAKVKSDLWTIAQGSPTVVGLDENGDSIIVKGRICSSDSTGNIYKNIIVQGENEKGEQVALTFAVNQTKLWQSYQFGQEIFINLTGMTVGNYNGLMQFGAVGDKGMSFMDASLFTAQAHASGLPEHSKVLISKTTIAELNEAKTNAMELWQSRLVCVENVHFEEPGIVLATDAATSRYIADEDGNRLIIRTSAYASFKNDLTPDGTGSVYGILSSYSGSWQLTLINPTCLQGFTPYVAPEPGGPVEGSLTSLNEKFSGSQIPAGWTDINVSGDKKWFTGEFGGVTYAAMTGYKGSKPPYDEWLVTPAIDIDKVEKKVLSFRSSMGAFGGTTTNFKVCVLNTTDLSKATITELNPTLASSNSGYSDWVASGDIDLSAFSGTIYIGFRYEAAQAENYDTWRITDVVLGDGSGSGDTPVDPATELTFVKATTIESGARYALVVDGQLATAIGQNLDYGRFGLADVTIADDKFTAADTQAVLFTEVAGKGFTMTDAYGRILSMETGHNTNFQLYTTANDGSYWEATYEADGTVKLTNTSSGCIVAKSKGSQGTWFTNLAPALNPTEYMLPVLYKAQ